MLIARYIFGALFFLFFYFYLSLPFYSGDVKNHIVWGASILHDGLLGFYQREFHNFSFPNYPPVSMLLFASSVWLYDFVYHWSMYLNLKFSFFPSAIIPFLQGENTQISFLKLPAILPLIGLGFLLAAIYKLVIRGNEKTNTILRHLFLLNPAVVYLAVIWGQNDLLQNLFLLLAIYLLLKEKLWWSFLAAGLAILSKQTILMLWLVYLFVIFKKYGLQKSLYGLFASLGLLFISYLPFHEFSLTWPFVFYKETLKTTGYLVSDNAINFWGLIFNFAKVDASSTYLGLPLEVWGYVLFIPLALPVIWSFWKQEFTYKRVFQLFFIISALYFLVLTRMHERYMVPVIVFTSVLVIFKKKLYWVNLIFFSILHFINLYRGLLQPDIPLLNRLISSALFLNTLVLGYIILLGINVVNFFKDE